MPNFHLPFSPRPPPSFLSPSVLWCLFGMLIATSGVCLGLSLDPNTTTSRYDPNFYNLMAQLFLTVFACYCTLSPVLHAHLDKKINLQVNLHVFYIFIAIAVCAALVAPIVYVAASDAAHEGTSNVLAFVSSVSSAITASQLAAGVLKLGRGC